MFIPFVLATCLSCCSAVHETFPFGLHVHTSEAAAVTRTPFFAVLDPERVSACAVLIGVLLPMIMCLHRLVHNHSIDAYTHLSNCTGQHKKASGFSPKNFLLTHYSLFSPFSLCLSLSLSPLSQPTWEALMMPKWLSTESIHHLEPGTVLSSFSLASPSARTSL